MASSGLPESNAGHIGGFLFGLAPGGVYLATSCYHSRGALLPHPFTLTATVSDCGGLLSAALSVGSRLPGVTWHPALWSPDFPPVPCGTGDCSADSSASLCANVAQHKRLDSIVTRQRYGKIV